MVRMLLTPLCPLCSEPPILMAGTTLMCGNESCKTLFWRGDLTLGENLSQVEFVCLEAVNIDTDD